MKIVISGEAGSGKTLFANEIEKILEDMGIDFFNDRKYRKGSGWDDILEVDLRDRQDAHNFCKKLLERNSR